jgi:hypothetical protein
LHIARAVQKVRMLTSRSQKFFELPLKPNRGFPIFLLPPLGGPGA